MKTFVACLFSSMTASLLSFCIYCYSPTGIAEAEVLDLMNQLHQAEKHRDGEKLSQIMASEIFWSRYKDERRFTKEEFIENIKNMEWELESTEVTFVSTKIKSSRVEISFIMRQKSISIAGNISQHHGDYIYTFEKQSEKWKLTTIHLEN